MRVWGETFSGLERWELSDLGEGGARAFGRLDLSDRSNVFLGSPTLQISPSDVTSGVSAELPSVNYQGINGTDDGETLTGTEGDDVINGFGGNDVIEGLGGNDVINAGSGFDEVYGGDGNDTITHEFSTDEDDGNYLTAFGGEGDDIFDGIQFGTGEIYGEGGNDTLRANEGNYQLFGGDGDDLIIGGTGADSLFGGFGNDRIFGGDGDDIIESDGGGDDEYYGEGGNDEIFVTSGTNIVDGGEGDDIVTVRSGLDPIDASGSLIGGAGIDTVVWEGNGLPDIGVTVDLDVGFARSDDLTFDYTISGFEIFTGTRYDDTITGDAADNTLIGGRGTDIIDGGGGDDRIVTSSGFQRNDTAETDTGQYTGGDGSDTLVFGRLNVAPGPMEDGGGQGGATVSLQSGEGRYYAIYIDSGGNEAIKENFFTLNGFENIEVTTLGADRLTGNIQDNVITSKQAFIGGVFYVDVIDGAGGDDTIRVTAAGDFDGGDGVDTFEIYDNFIFAPGLNGAVSNLRRTEGVEIDMSSSTIVSDGFGNSGQLDNFENVIATNFNDIITGDDADNLFEARRGDDTIDGGVGTDVLRLGSNQSSYLFFQDEDGGIIVADAFGRSGIKRITDIELLQFSNGDQIAVSDITYSDFGAANILFARVDEGEFELTAVDGTDGADVIFGLFNPNTIRAGAGDDIIYAGTGQDRIFGEGGNDTLYAGDGRYLENYSRFVDGVRITTEFIFGDSLDGGGGDDLIIGRDGQDTLFGGDGNDTIYGGGYGDLISGGFGRDIIFGEDGDDIIELTGPGFTSPTAFLGDVIDGGEGTDVVTVSSNSQDRFRVLENLDGSYSIAEINRLNPVTEQYRYARITDVELIQFGSGSDQVVLDISDFAEARVQLDASDSVFNADEPIDYRVDGSASDDVINVGIGIDEVTGGAGDDVIRLGGHDDFGMGGDGDDVLDGAAGSDALFGGEGSDQLFGDNFIGVPADSAAAQLYRSYQAVFDRAPDAAGFDFFLGTLQAGVFTQEQVVVEFVGSDEFQDTYGDLTDRAFVEQLYRNVLDREGDAVGLDAFTAELEAGRLTRTQVVLEFANSVEFIATSFQGMAAFLNSVAISPYEGQVYRAYQGVFGRDPDLVGYELFIGALEVGLLDLQGIVDEFSGSAEFQATYGELSDRDFVELLYINVLPGNEDQTGRDAFTAALESGSLTRAEVVLEFTESFEFIETTEADALAFRNSVFVNSADTLDGGAGDDLLFGGRGADTFAYDTQAGGNDTVMDFTAGVDTIDLGDIDAFDTLVEITALGSQDGNDAVFDFGAGNTLRLANTSLVSLTASDFGLTSGTSAQAPKIEQSPVSECPPELNMIDATAMFGGRFWMTIDDAWL